MDAIGTGERKKDCLKGRSYHNPGSNYAWHIDGHGYDTLKHWGFQIHGEIGFSRKIL